MLHMEVVKRVNPKNSHHKKKLFSISLFVSIWDDGYLLTYCDNLFMMYVSHIIMLYTLYSTVCQLYLNKTGRKKQ